MKKLGLNRNLSFSEKLNESGGVTFCVATGAKKVVIEIDAAENIVNVVLSKEILDSEEWTFFLNHYFKEKNCEYLSNLTVKDFYKRALFWQRETDLRSSYNKFICRFVDDYENEKGSLFVPVILMIQILYTQYLKNNKIEYQYCDEDGENYVCRCTGVTAKEITAFIQRNSLLSLSDISDELGVAAGCAACLKDVKSIIHDHSKGQARKSPIDKVLAVNEFLQANVGKKKSSKVDFEIMSFRDNKLLIRGNIANDQIKQKQLLEKFSGIDFVFKS